jgi:hypothetical protein
MKGEKKRVHIRMDEQTRDAITFHAYLMSKSLGRSVSVGEWLGHLMDDVSPLRIAGIRNRLKEEEAGK